MSASDKAKLLAKIFSMNSNLNDSHISLPASRTTLKLHNILVSPKVITNLDLSKGSGTYCISEVVLKNCEPYLSYTLAELFNKCLKESCFQNFWKVSFLPSVFKSVVERTTA